MKYMIIAILWAGLTTAAYSDEVLLTNGHKILGIAREEPGQVIVEINIGTVRISRAEVESIIPGKTLLHEYREHVSVLSLCSDAAATFDLARWAQAHGLTRYVNSLLQQTILLDPEHVQARNMLGYVYYHGQWIWGLDLKKEQGWVHVRGTWVAPVERDAFCTPEPVSCGAVQAQRRVPFVKRLRAQPEGVPYSFGLTAYPKKGTHHFGSGAYSIWGGVIPTQNLMNLPLIQNHR
jgi:hypothetical protein